MNRLRWFVANFLVIAASFALMVNWLHRPTANHLVRYAEQGNIAGVKYCLARGVHPNVNEKWGWRPEKCDGRTPLTAAAQTGQIEVVRLLLRNGAKVNLRDFGPDYPHGTPLCVAAGGGHVEVCKVLLEAGADPNIRCGSPPGWTALDWALQRKNPTVVELLRQHGGVEGNRRNSIWGRSLPAP